jgi:transcriptional regulator with PAS, ATPase and Fis domain
MGRCFLDEIGNLPLEVQAGILKVIEEKSLPGLVRRIREVLTLGFFRPQTQT